MERAVGLAPEDRDVTCAWIAEMWACDQSTVRKLIRRGLLPAHKLGGMVRVRMADLITYEAAAAEPVPAPIPSAEPIGKPSADRPARAPRGSRDPAQLARALRARFRKP